jgi:hypothetical protein
VEKAGGDRSRFASHLCSHRIAMNLTQLTLLIMLGALFVILAQLLAFWRLG